MQGSAPGLILLTFYLVEEKSKNNSDRKHGTKITLWRDPFEKKMCVEKFSVKKFYEGKYKKQLLTLFTWENYFLAFILLIGVAFINKVKFSLQFFFGKFS